VIVGLVYVDGVVKHDGKGVGVRFLVDSGAMYTVLTKSVWEELGLKPMGEVEFVLADGTVIKRAISEALLELPGYGEWHTPWYSARAKTKTCSASSPWRYSA